MACRSSGILLDRELDADAATTVAGMAGASNFDVNLAITQTDQDDIRRQLEAADVQGQRAAIRFGKRRSDLVDWPAQPERRR